MKSNLFSIIIIFFCAAISSARPPKVIKMIPENGAVDVKPGPTKIRILFDQDMSKGGHSLCGGGESFPEIAGEPKWASKRAFVFSANLQPNHDYSFGINCPSAQNFKSVRGEPAEILFVNFKTVGANGVLTKSSNVEKTPTWKYLSHLDADTRSQLVSFERFFSSCYQYPQEYRNASETQKTRLEDKWIKELSSQDQNAIATAASYLGMVRSQSAAEPLEKILSNPPGNGRLRWTCTRALGQIGQNSSIPILINLIDDTNANTCIYARVSLAEITEVYFGRDKEKWTAWHKDPSSVTYSRPENTTPAGTNQHAFERLRNAIDNAYSYKNLKGLDWDQLYDRYKASLLKAENPTEFANKAAHLLSHAKDKHIWLTAGKARIGSYNNPKTPNVNSESIPKIIPNFKKCNGTISKGKFPDNIGYISINNWSRHKESEFTQLYTVLNELNNTDGLIIDVRMNSGGSEPIAQEFAGCFVDEAKVYAKHVYRNVGSPDGFGNIQERILKPNKKHPSYHGKVAVLSGPVVMSSCEAFVLMMKQVPGCKIVGGPTQGSSGNPKPHDLGNGVTVYLPSWKALLPDETCFEGKGIWPDIPVKFNRKSTKSNDPVIEAALRELKR
ncbi:MAG: S41 family peptidase [Planctomycetota bacterium]|jgi:hypothetical protein